MSETRVRYSGAGREGRKKTISDDHCPSVSSAGMRPAGTPEEAVPKRQGISAPLLGAVVRVVDHVEVCSDTKLPLPRPEICLN